jgi:hypothetical protein
MSESSALAGVAFFGGTLPIAPRFRFRSAASLLPSFHNLLLLSLHLDTVVVVVVVGLVAFLSFSPELPHHHSLQVE